MAPGGCCSAMPITRRIPVPRKASPTPSVTQSASPTPSITASQGRRPLAEALAEYARQSVEWALPFYELTCQMATFAPATARHARHSIPRSKATRQAIDRFIGLITEATSPARLFRAGARATSPHTSDGPGTLRRCIRKPEVRRGGWRPGESYAYPTRPCLDCLGRRTEEPHDASYPHSQRGPGHDHGAAAR